MTAPSVPPHRAFFAALGSMPESSPEWRAVLAGLLTLRYLDAWADTGATSDDLTFEREAVERAIKVLPANAPERIYLAGLVDASTTDRTRDFSRVVSLLLAYGRALQRRKDWALASDVFIRAYGACQSTTQPLQLELSIAALLRAGQCHRELGDAAGARQAYETALAIGHAAADEYTVRRARAALARLAADRPAVTEDSVLAGPVLDDRP